MERHHHDKHPPPLVPPRRVRSDREPAGASFSASLLDAIYRSLDDGNDENGADITSTKSSVVPVSQKKETAPPQFWWASEKAELKPAVTAAKRWHEPAVARPRHSGYASSTSSDSSSSYGFFCSSSSTSDAEPSHRRHHLSPPPPLVAVAAAATTPPHCKAKKKKKRPCLLGARLRELRNLKGRKSPSSSPPSPASFACLLKALFTLARLQRKPKSPTAAPPPISPAPPTSGSKPSCMSTSRTKAPDVTEAVERRSARFSTDVDPAVVRRRVEELVRSLGEVAEEDDEEGSDASSDLFELESLRDVDGDELPVYGTTSLSANRAIAQGVVC